MKCPEEFDFFCPIEKAKNFAGETYYYIHVPEWVWRATRRKHPHGFLQVHFGKGTYGGYTFRQHLNIESKIKKYYKSRSYKALRKKMQKEEIRKAIKEVNEK